MMTDQPAPWWKKGIIYQIYPRSFQDSNGDGIGDLPGITQRLEYVQSLNVDAIWISPIFPSPMHDFGYDVSDYTAIHPIFGTMDDFDRLLERAHALNLRVLLDLVPNHTSDEHPWFIESRRDRTNPKRDWYIWRDPAPDGGPPNNWLSSFGGPAWEFDSPTGQYYLHSFVKQQPDLNYRNPQVLQAMLDVMRFWLDKGVDGFRVDVITALVKHQHLLDEPENPSWNGVDPYHRLSHIHSRNLPEVHEVIRQMRALMDDYDDRVLVGEIWGLPNEEMAKYYGEDLDECHLPFNFNLIHLSWDAAIIRQAIANYERALPDKAWPNWVLGNHDEYRIASRVGQAQARVANMLLLTLRGTPTVYNGEEIGMENVPIPPEMVKDPPAVLQPEIAHILGRDPQRTPMQWDASPNAGFTQPGVQPWLPIATNYAVQNVAAQSRVGGSMLNLFRALTDLRQAEPALSLGDYQPVSTYADDEVLAYLRSFKEEGQNPSDSFLVVLNMGDKEHTLDFRSLGETAEIALDTSMERSGPVDLSVLNLWSNEGVILRLPTKEG